MEAQTNLREQLERRIQARLTNLQLVTLSTPEQITERRIRALKKHFKVDYREEPQKASTVAERIEQMSKPLFKFEAVKKRDFMMGELGKKFEYGRQQLGQPKQIPKALEEKHKQPNIPKSPSKPESSNLLPQPTIQAQKPITPSPQKKNLWHRQGAETKVDTEFTLFGMPLGKVLPPSELSSQPLLNSPNDLFKQPGIFKEKQPEKKKQPQKVEIVIQPEPKPEPQMPAINLFSRPQMQKEYTGPSVKMTLPTGNISSLFSNTQNTALPTSAPVPTLTTNKELLFANKVIQKPKQKMEVEKSVELPKPVQQLKPIPLPKQVQQIPEPNPNIKQKKVPETTPSVNIFGQPTTTKPLLFPKAHENQTDKFKQFEQKKDEFPKPPKPQVKKDEPKPSTNIFGQLLHKDNPKQEPKDATIPANPLGNIFSNVLKKQTPKQEPKAAIPSNTPPPPQPKPALNLFAPPTNNIFNASQQPQKSVVDLFAPPANNIFNPPQEPKPNTQPPKQNQVTQAPAGLNIFGQLLNPSAPQAKNKASDSTPEPSKQKPKVSFQAAGQNQTPTANNPQQTKSPPSFSMFKGTTAELFAKVNQQPDIFKQKQSQPATNNIFGQLPSTSPATLTPNATLFASKTYNFGQPSANQIKAPPADDEQQGDDDDDDPLQDEDNANPNLSTGNYKYAATTETLEKSEANHFRRNETDTVKDVVVSLEKTIADGKYNVLVRSIKTKIITYQGLVVKGQTKAEHMNNNKQNVKIMKLFSLENDKPRPDLLKIQFREAFDGAAFMKALQKCL